jgi:hypothetical protein
MERRGSGRTRIKLLILRYLETDSLLSLTTPLWFGRPPHRPGRSDRHLCPSHTHQRLNLTRSSQLMDPLHVASACNPEPGPEFPFALARPGVRNPGKRTVPRRTLCAEADACWRRATVLIFCGSLFHAINDHCLERSLAVFQTESKFQQSVVERA